MQRLGRIDIMEELLTNTDTPALITDVHEDIIAAVEGAEGEAGAYFWEFEDLLCDEDGFFEGFAGKFVGAVWDYTDSSGGLLAWVMALMRAVYTFLFLQSCLPVSDSSPSPLVHLAQYPVMSWCPLLSIVPSQGAAIRIVVRT